MKPGSHHVAAEVVARALLERGATNLQAKVGAAVASYGEHCWVSDTQMRDHLVRRGDGRPYHRESIGRARRLLARAGCIKSERVFPAQKPLGAKYRTTHGTTSKCVLWKTLGLKCPMTRGDRKQRRMDQAELTRPAPSTEYNAPARSSRVPVDPHLMALVAGIGSTTVTAPARRNPIERPVDRARRADDDTQDKAARALRALEEWKRQNERGPP